MSIIEHLRDRLVADKGLQDLSANPELASFPLFGVCATGESMDFVGFRIADGLTEKQVTSLCNEFHQVIVRLSNGGRASGLLGFIFEAGCSESMARVIRKQTRISRSASTSAVVVSWALDSRHRRIHTHQNPVSVVPPVTVVSQTVFPGLEWLESNLKNLPDAAGDPVGSESPQGTPPPRAHADVTRILFVGANSTEAPLDLEREVSRIEQDLQMARERDALKFRHVGAVTIDRLIQAMLDDPPNIVHFAGHGSTQGIFLRDEAGDPRMVSGDALANLFALFRDSVQCVVLNACWSEAQAHCIRRHVPHVIGSRDQIQDAAALAFSAGFYKAIGAGRDVPFAFEMGKARIGMEGCGGQDLLVLL